MISEAPTRPAQRLLGWVRSNTLPIMFGLNCLGSAFWAKHGWDHKTPLFMVSAGASVLSSGLLAVAKSDWGGEGFDRLKKNTRTYFAGPLHNFMGVPTIVAGWQNHIGEKPHDYALMALGMCTVGGSLYAVWGDPLLRATKADKLMQALKIDKIPLFKNPDASTAAFIIYLGVIPTVFQDALKFGAPYLAAAGACYTLSILSLPFRRQKQTGLSDVLSTPTATNASAHHP